MVKSKKSDNRINLKGIKWAINNYEGWAGILTVEGIDLKFVVNADCSYDVYLGDRCVIDNEFFADDASPLFKVSKHKPPTSKLVLRLIKNATAFINSEAIDRADELKEIAAENLVCALLNASADKFKA